MTQGASSHQKNGYEDDKAAYLTCPNCGHNKVVRNGWTAKRQQKYKCQCHLDRNRTCDCQLRSFLDRQVVQASLSSHGDLKTKGGLPIKTRSRRKDQRTAFPHQPYGYGTPMVVPTESRYPPVPPNNEYPRHEPAYPKDEYKMKGDRPSNAFAYPGSRGVGVPPPVRSSETHSYGRDRDLTAHAYGFQSNGYNGYTAADAPHYNRSFPEHTPTYPIDEVDGPRYPDHPSRTEHPSEHEYPKPPRTFGGDLSTATGVYHDPASQQPNYQRPTRGYPPHGSYTPHAYEHHEYDATFKREQSRGPFATQDRNVTRHTFDQPPADFNAQQQRGASGRYQRESAPLEAAFFNSYPSTTPKTDRAESQEHSTPYDGLNNSQPTPRYEQEAHYPSYGEGTPSFSHAQKERYEPEQHQPQPPAGRPRHDLSVYAQMEQPRDYSYLNSERGQFGNSPSAPFEQHTDEQQRRSQYSSSKLGLQYLLGLP
eukprot:Colp12_sorted_trinity150504_noHs@19485